MPNVKLWTEINKIINIDCKGTEWDQECKRNCQCDENITSNLWGGEDKGNDYQKP